MFEDYYMPEFDADYFNSPAFQQAIAAAVEQYSPAPVEPVYYAPPPAPTYYEPEATAGIGDIPQYMVDDYGLIGGAPDRFTAPQISAEQLAAERYAADQAAQQAEAQRAAQAAADRAAQERALAEQAAAEQAAAAQAAAAAEAQRVAAAQELAARVEAERVAAERAAAAEAAAQRQQTELNERRAQAAQAAAERAAQERALAEQAAAQAAAEAQAAAQAQAQAAAQAEAQRVAAAQAQAEARAQAQAAEQARVQAEAQAAQQAEAQRVAEVQAAEEVYTPAPAPSSVEMGGPELISGIGQGAEEIYTPAPAAAPVSEVYTPAPQITRGIGGRGEYEDDVYAAQIPETYTPAPAAVYTPPPEPVQVYTPAPEPAPVYTPPPEPVRGIGRRGEYDDDVYAAQVSEVSAPAAEPMTIQAEPVAGIGSPAVAAAAAPSSTGLQVINANDYSPSDTDLQTMQLSRDQWNEMMASFATMDLGNLNFGNSFGITNPDATNNFRTFTAPKSNKGNPTSTVAKKDNTFNLIEGQPIRLVDMRTKKVVFQGTGYEAAQKAIELAAGLTKEGGNKADWEIQTGQFKNPGSGDLVFGDSFKTVANEKKNVSVLNQALDILGDAALGFIIGGPVGAAIAAGASAAGVNVSDIAYPIIAASVLGPVGFAATAGAAALGSAVSSVVQGRSIEETLIRAGITGLTAGLMEGTEIGGKISKAVGDTLKSVGVESQTGNIGREIGNLINGTVDKATGDIIVTAAKKAAEEAVKAAGASAIGGTVSSVVSKAVVDSVQKTIVEEAAKANDIVVTANPVTTAVSGTNPIVETAAGIAGGFSGVGDVVNSPELRDRIAEEKARVEEPKEEIVVTATPEPEVIPVPVPEVAGIGGAIAPIVVTAPKVVQPPPEEPVPEASGIGGAIAPIVVTAPKVVQPPPEETEVAGIGTPGVVDPVSGDIVVSKPKPEPEPVTKEEGLPVGSVLATLPLTGLPTPDPALTEEKSTFEKVKDAVNIARAGAAVIPLIAGGGGGGDDGPLVPSGGRYDVNPNRSDIFGTRRPATIGFNPFTYGQATGDQPGEYLFFTRDPVTGAPTIPAPITTPTANEPAGPAMILPSDNTFAEGGEVDDDMAAHLMAYHKNGGHTGPGQVKGIGSGQEDKIPAWLSDGEYVWSAQDVADLGDGSTDEGVRRLDKMRHMVRRRAGRKDVKKIAKPQKGIDHMLKAVGGSV